MPEQQNSIADLKRYLSTPENPVTMQEFNNFWIELSEEEKVEFKSTPLDK